MSRMDGDTVGYQLHVRYISILIHLLLIPKCGIRYVDSRKCSQGLVWRWLVGIALTPVLALNPGTGTSIRIRKALGPEPTMEIINRWECSGKDERGDGMQSTLKPCSAHIWTLSIQKQKLWNSASSRF
ncbi:hypothetical protein EI94DRAFT_719924 [Lactarius quietus]|nr:hypothetical protein EI94DRAFT_719924 [Lactarius quietus]